MRCPSCDTVSLGAICTTCGAVQVSNPQVAGFDPTDLFNPYQLGYDLGKSGVNPFNPIGTGETLGTGIREGTIGSSISGATGAVSSLANTMKWIMIGGAVILGGIVVYGGIKFIPVALGFAKSEGQRNAEFARKFLGK
jgi:hypothetical protein